MMKDKTYRYDDAFKAKARAHQFAFRENILNDYYEEKAHGNSIRKRAR